MKKLSLITLILCLFALTGCHHWWWHHVHDGRCPPGHAKKGNC